MICTKKKLCGAFDRVSLNPSQKLQPPPRMCMGAGPQSVSKAVKRPLSYDGAATPAEQKVQSIVQIQPMNPHTARELRTRRNGL